MRIFGLEIIRAAQIGQHPEVWNRGTTAPIGCRVEDMTVEQLRTELSWAYNQALQGDTLVISGNNRVLSLNYPRS